MRHHIFILIVLWFDELQVCADALMSCTVQSLQVLVANYNMGLRGRLDVVHHAITIVDRQCIVFRCIAVLQVSTDALMS